MSVNQVVFEQLKDILADLFTITDTDIRTDSKLIEDLGADSLDMVDLAYVLQDEFNLEEISDEQSAAFITVGDILSHIDDSTNQKQPV